MTRKVTLAIVCSVFSKDARMTTTSTASLTIFLGFKPENATKIREDGRGV